MSRAVRIRLAGLAAWWREGTPEARRALLAASLGWMLDAFDIMLYSLVLGSLLEHFSISKTTGGLLGSLTLAASALGGIAFGLFADRAGRKKALMASILVYSVFTAACGLSQSVLQLAVFRFLLGFGMGGEWTSGAALVSETWPDRHRGKALGVMQSFWAIGYAGAALANFLLLPHFGWRGVFFVGLLPAAFTLWIRRRVAEPALWLDRHATTGAWRSLRSRRLLGVTAVATMMNALTLFAYWGFNLWIPAYLSLERGRGGMGLSPGWMLVLLISMQTGMWLGYLTFGYISDRWGRRRSYVVYLLAAAALVLIYSTLRTPLPLFLLGPFVAFFGTGYFSGFGALTAELYPTSVRATLQGFTYNSGRLVSAAAPLLVGSLAEHRGFSFAFLLIAGSFLLAAGCWRFLPETRGRPLE